MTTTSSRSHQDALLPLCHGMTYGPVRSRRLGVSLGVNVLPPLDKVCTFNCPYCQYGFTPPWTRVPIETLAWPAPGAVAAALAARARALASDGIVLDRITLAGHGEPTLHPAFGDVVDAIRATRDAHLPGVRLAILSNATTADVPEIRAALVRLDDRYMKLDAGDQDTLRHLNATAHDVERLVAALAGLPSIVLQSMFVQDRNGRIDNTTAQAVAAWLRAVERVRPSGVHLYSLDREPAWEQLRRVPRPRLEAIAADVRALGVEAMVFA